MCQMCAPALTQDHASKGFLRRAAIAQASLIWHFIHMCATFIGLLGIALAAAAKEKLEPLRPSVYVGMCDASAGVAVSSNLFAAASDEDNTLRLYHSDSGGPPVSQFNLDEFLQVEGRFREADLEGAARIGNLVYWIGSHGRNRVGKERLNRCRFFATRIVENGTVTLAPAGRPYKDLLEDMVADPRLQKFDLAASSTEAPKEEDALNIEGLAATPEKQLLIGFRNPIPHGKALILPLLNPHDLIEGAHARFGKAIQLDLGGLGIRDMAACRSGYFIIAGSYHGGGHFRFYRWPGPGAEPKRIAVRRLKDYSPEAVVIYPEKTADRIQILSDDGTRLLDGIPCKTLKGAGQFRAFWLELPAS